MIENLSEIVKESLKHYVYALIDPRYPNEFFYIGEGTGDRVLQHVKGALNSNDSNLKYDTIRDILNNNLEVKYIILRHGIETLDESFNIESSMIDLYNYQHPDKPLTNIVAGHHQNEFGIKTLDEIIIQYDCPLADIDLSKKYICINPKHTYINDIDKAYKSFKEWWKLSYKSVIKADYVLIILNGVIRHVYKPTNWYMEQYKIPTGKIHNHVGFDGIEIKDSPLIKTKIDHLITFNQLSARYLGNWDKKKKNKK